MPVVTLHSPVIGLTHSSDTSDCGDESMGFEIRGYDLGYQTFKAL